MSERREWTPEYVEKLERDYGWAGVAHNHNAALASEREKGQGALHHMEACRALLNVPDDEVLYQAIKALIKGKKPEESGGDER